MPRRHLFTPLLRVGQALRPFLPPSLKQKIPPLSLTRAKSSAALASGKAGRVPDGKRPLPAEPAGAARSAAGGQAGPDALLLGGCVQTPATPNVNRALQELLAHLGIKAQIIDIACCGSLDYHLAAPEAAKARMRQVMAAVAPYPGLPVISSATGCALTLKDYGEIFKAEPEAREAAAFSRRLVEASEFLAQRPLRCTPCKVAVHTPCTLQHGMQQGSQLEALLAHAGFTVLPVQDSHLCCGSAGAYSLLQPKIAARLRAEKLAALTAPAPEVIVTANIGCHLHLAAASPVPVLHWAELLAPRLLPS